MVTFIGRAESENLVLSQGGQSCCLYDGDLVNSQWAENEHPEGHFVKERAEARGPEEILADLWNDEAISDRILSFHSLSAPTSSCTL